MYDQRATNTQLMVSARVRGHLWIVTVTVEGECKSAWSPLDCDCNS